MKTSRIVETTETIEELLENMKSNQSNSSSLELIKVEYNKEKCSTDILNTDQKNIKPLFTNSLRNQINTFKFVNIEERMRIEEAICKLFPDDIETILNSLIKLPTNNSEGKQVTWSYVLNKYCSSRIRDKKEQWKQLLGVLLTTKLIEERSGKIIRRFIILSDGKNDKDGEENFI